MQSDGSLADTAWGTGVDGAALLAELKTLELEEEEPFANAEGARDVAELVGAANDSSLNGAAAKAVADAASHHLAEGTAFSGREAGASAGPLEDGYYVVASAQTDKDSSRSLVFPALIVVSGGDTKLTPKEAAPCLEKQVLEDSSGVWGAAADADMGQSISFRVRASLPDALLERSHLSCRIVDKLPSGMELDLDSLSLRSGDADVSGLFGVDYSDSVLTLEAVELADTELPCPCEIELAYTARLTPSSPLGGVGSVSAARLEVEADGQRCSTPESKTAVFTYRLEITKVDATNHAKTLAGASFVLKRDDGQFAVVKDGCLDSWANSKDAATQLTTGDDGKVRIAGLDSGDYALIETQAPSGYRARSGDIPLSIQSELGFDVAAEEGRLSSLKLASGNAASPGDAATGTLCCTLENATEPIANYTPDNPKGSAPLSGQSIPSTGDSARQTWALATLGAAIGAVCVAVALCAKSLARHGMRQGAHGPTRIVSIFMILACLLAHGGCLPLKALADEGLSTLVISSESYSDDAASSLGLVFESDESTLSSAQSAPSTRLSLGASPISAARVDSSADIPRSTANSYINVLNMSFENAYVMVNDTANFAYSGSSPINTYINCSFGAAGYGGYVGDYVARMVLYRGTPGAHGAGTEMFGADTISDTTGNGLVAIWFKDAGVLSDTGESVSMLLKLKEYMIMPNYEDLFYCMNGSSVAEKTMSYRQFVNDGYSDVPLLYILKAEGLDQTKPENARSWMNSVWRSQQAWEITFYRSSQIPSLNSSSAGYSMASLGLTSDQIVSTATNGESYLARQYCYDLDISGIRWLNPEDGSYDSDSEYASPTGSKYGKGGAYFTSAGAESFAWVSGTASGSYIATSSNLKTDSWGGLTYWLHDQDKTAGGSWVDDCHVRWQSYHESGNTDWRNALAADVLPFSSFMWSGTGCCTGINLNSQFTGTGTLRLSKTVDDGSGASFPFRITLESPSYTSGTLSWKPLSGSYSYQITDADGNVVGSGSLSTGASVNLAGGQTLSVLGIPEGTRYAIVETSHACYQPTEITSTGVIVADEFLGTIVNGATNDVNITNVKLLAPATWTIVKEGQSGEKLKDAEFTIRYFAANNASGTPARTWVIKSDAEGIARLDEAHKVSGDDFYVDVYGEIGIPVGTITVEETRAPDCYERDDEVRTFYVSSGQDGISSTLPNALTIKNSLLTGKLAVTKKVSGTGADANRGFSFTVRLARGGSALSGTFGGVTFTDGAASFTLKAGQTKVIEGIPVGTTYEVNEAAVAGYSVSWENRTGTIAANATATATATNAYSATGKARLALTKVFDTNGPELQDGQFTFKLHKDSPDGEVVATSACDVDGTIAFEISFDQEAIGQTLTYYVTEVNDGQSGVSYDTHAAKVNVSVSDNGDGTLKTNVTYAEATFTNSFRKYQLPSTGLGGIVGTIAAGVGLTAGAAVGLTRIGKARQRRR